MRKFSVSIIILSILAVSVVYYLKSEGRILVSPELKYKSEMERIFKKSVGIDSLLKEFKIPNAVIVGETPLYRKNKEWVVSFSEEQVEAYQVHYKYDDLQETLKSLRRHPLLYEEIEVDAKTSSIKVIVRVRDSMK